MDHRLFSLLGLFGPLLLTLSCASPPWTIVAGGDVGLARNTGRFVDREGPEELLRGLRPFLDDALVLANFEGALGVPGAARVQGSRSPELVLVAPAQRALALRGLTAVSLANNHSLDGGLAGWNTTVAALDALGITPVNGLSYVGSGARMAAIVAVTEAFTELSGPGGPGPVALASETGTADEVRRARTKVGKGPVIVLVHWGQENSPYVTNRQRAWGRAWIDAGADLVLGSHPHRWQAIEPRGRGLIAYSLGNLAFDSGGTEVRETGLLRVRWSPEAGVLGYEVIPLRLEGPGRVPVVVDNSSDIEKNEASSTRRSP